MGTPFAVTVANAFMYYHEKDIVVYYSQYLAVYKRVIDDVFAIWCGPKDILMKFLGALNNKTERIKLTYNISENRTLPVFNIDTIIQRDNREKLRASR
ncbi:hypothetical protein ACROYT_G036253 [Oculina patagonica]